MHAAREEFVKNESCEKIRRALKHQVRPSSNVKFFIGDDVYYKRLKSRTWRGPATVIGQDGQQVLVKHGSYMYRVHPCMLKLRQEASEVKTSNIEILPDNSDGMRSPDNMHESGEDTVVLDEDESDSDTADAGNDDVGITADASGQQMNPTTDHTRENGSSTSSIHANALKKDMNITYSLVGDPDKWYTGSVKRRTGKAKGKYKHWWAVQNDEQTNKQ